MHISIRLALLNFLLLRPDIALSLPCWLSQFSFSKLRQSPGLRQSNVRMQKKVNQANLILILWGKSGMYHQIWIQNNVFRFHCVRHNLVRDYMNVIYCKETRQKKTYTERIFYILSLSVGFKFPVTRWHSIFRGYLVTILECYLL